MIAVNKKEWDAAFPETPEIVHRAVSRGFLEGQRRERKRRRLTQSMAIAATLAVMLGMGLLMRQASLHSRQEQLAQNASTPPAQEATQSPDALQTQTAFPTAETPLASTMPPAEEATPAPTAAVTEAPTDDVQYDVNVSDGADGEMVYFREDGSCYHAQAECELAWDASQEEMSVLQSADRETAEEMGLYPCPACLFQADKAYVAEGETVYHREPFCGGSSGAAGMRPCGLLEALEDGRTACTACTGVEQVGVEENNIYYHMLENCSRLSQLTDIVQWVTEDQALLTGHFPCTECTGVSTQDADVEEWELLVSAGQICAYRMGNVCHLDAECAGEGAEWILVGQALREGMVRCSRCARDDGQSNDDYMKAYSEELGDYYFTVGGTYYHTLPECSGMRNANPHSLSLALCSGKQPCPVCFPYDSTSQDSVRRYAMALFQMCFGAECPLENVMTESTTSARGMQDECTLHCGTVSYSTVSPSDGLYMNATTEDVSIALSMSEENAQAMQDFVSGWQNSLLIEAYDAALAKVNEASNTTCSLQALTLWGTMDESRHMPTLTSCTFSFLMQNPDTGFKIAVEVGYSMTNQRIQSMDWSYD